ncbi:MAG: cobyrinate a,c-diamide synthase [Leptolyngbya sp. SIO1E4]|nr:cobyrinate a,c-diamide synthase [Leptolyngbya sp. SIO1E4]
MGGLIIAGDRSGAGKTTVTMAVLSALRAQGATVQAFKVGPDYIDPMFHRAITGRPAYNLDPVLTSEAYVQRCFQRHRATAPYAVVEGAMGLFDGAGGTDWASTAHIARLLACPVLLVVDCARLSRSLAAIVHGYKTLDSRVNIAGVVLNRVGSDRHLAMLKAAIASIRVPVLGVLRREDAITLPDRHLGLVPTDELSDLPERFHRLAALGQRCFDWAQLELLFKQPSIDVLDGPLNPPILVDFNASSPQSWGAGGASPSSYPIRVGIARDRAFNFYYEDNLEMLTRLGAELVPFSPLSDAILPPDLNGLYLGGGFPEMFAEELSQNEPMRRAIAQQLTTGLPTYAECGGLMYLCRELTDFEGRSWPMVSALPATTIMTSKLTLGYRQVMVKQTSPLVTPGQQFWGHEFHRSMLEPVPSHPLYELASYPLPGEEALSLGVEGWGSKTIHGSYVHVHWGDRVEMPKRFLEGCDRP